MSWLFTSDGQSIGASASASVLPMNIQGWFPFGLTGWILQSKGLSRVFSNTTVQKHQFFGAQPSLWSNSHIHIWLLEKTIALTIWTFVGKVMSLLFNTLSGFVIAFLPRSKCLFNFMAAVTVHNDFGAQENSLLLFPLFLIYLPSSDGAGCHYLSFVNVEFSASFFTLFHPHQEALCSSSLSAIRMVSSAYLKLLVFLPAILIPACLPPARYFTSCTLHIR